MNFTAWPFLNSLMWCFLRLVVFPDGPVAKAIEEIWCFWPPLLATVGWADNSVFPNFGLAVRLPGFPTTARCRVWRRIGWLHSVACSHVGARQVPEPAWGGEFVTRAVPAWPGSRREDSELLKSGPFGLPSFPAALK